MKIDHLFADVVCIFVYFQILMWATWCWCWWWWLWEIKITVYLSTLPPCPGHPHWPGSYHWTPSPQSSHLLLGVAAGSPLSWSHHLGPHWTSLWARDSAQSSRARVTSSYSHCHIVRFTTHPARKSGNLNQSPIVAKALPLSTIAQTVLIHIYFCYSLIWFD